MKLENSLPMIAKKGDKNDVRRTSYDRRIVTTMVCVNASGYKMPPMLVVKGKTKKSIQSYNVRTAQKRSHAKLWTRIWNT